MVTWIDALARTRRQIAGVLSRVFSGRKKEDVSFEALEETLLLADVPVQLATKLVAEMELAYKGLQVSRREVLRTILRDSLKGAASEPFAWPAQPRPLVILVVGVNGSGKTTTSAKLARRATRDMDRARRDPGPERAGPGAGVPRGRAGPGSRGGS